MTNTQKDNNLTMSDILPKLTYLCNMTIIDASSGCYSLRLDKKSSYKSPCKTYQMYLVLQMTFLIVVYDVDGTEHNKTLK